ncbi:hypothetical protein [Streptomyces swartbergensis]|uniref:hypothetical protein n=1 Tax=Streptomyces swartbergensis TaxID=487165 RepID=UPI0013029D52|nr:hypothetical protein [Streptomyces swartbergensis]
MRRVVGDQAIVVSGAAQCAGAADHEDADPESCGDSSTVRVAPTRNSSSTGVVRMLRARTTVD